MSERDERSTSSSNEEQHSTNLPIKRGVQRSPDRTKRKTYREGNQCVRIKRNGEQCQKAPILGGTVCRFHGGAAGHVKLAAKARLEMAAMDAVTQLKRLMWSGETDAVKLAAAKDILDRAGITPRHALDVVHELKPWEQVLEGVYRGTPSHTAPMVVEGEIVPSDSAEFGDGREI